MVIRHVFKPPAVSFLEQSSFAAQVTLLGRVASFEEPDAHLRTVRIAATVPLLHLSASLQHAEMHSL